MSLDSVRKHIRAALDDAVASEKERLHELFDATDASIIRRIDIMRPVIEALEALRGEVAEMKGVTISTDGPGHMATIELEGDGSSKFLSISTSNDNSRFEIESRAYFSFNNETVEFTQNLSTADEVLELVVGSVGKHVAAIKVLDERRK